MVTTFDLYKLDISEDMVVYIHNISTSLSETELLQRVGTRIPLGNKDDDVSVICTYIGSSVEKQIFRGRHPEMTFHLFLACISHFCAGVSAVQSRNCSNTHLEN